MRFKPTDFEIFSFRKSFLILPIFPSFSPISHRLNKRTKKWFRLSPLQREPAKSSCKMPICRPRVCYSPYCTNNDAIQSRIQITAEIARGQLPTITQLPNFFTSLKPVSNQSNPHEATKLLLIAFERYKVQYPTKKSER